MIKAELNCLNCGRFLGVVISERDVEGLEARERLRYQPGAVRALRTPTGLRCDHCGGKAMVLVA